jgi:hypothetical protein
METLPEARAALRGQEIAWLADPIDALVLQIQGSGRLRMVDAAGASQTVCGCLWSLERPPRPNAWPTRELHKFSWMQGP